MRKTTYTYYCDVCNKEILENNQYIDVLLELRQNDSRQAVKLYPYLCDSCFDGILNRVNKIFDDYKQIDRRGSVV